MSHNYNAVLLIRNICLDSIKKDPLKFWKKVEEELNKKEHERDSELTYFGFNGSANGYAVVVNDPVEYTDILAIGQNYATVLAKYKTSYGHHKKEDKIKLLKKLAEDLGFKLVKKRL